VGPIGCPETSVRNCHYLLRNSPEERSSQRKYKEMALTSHEKNKGKTRKRAEEESQALQLI